NNVICFFFQAEDGIRDLIVTGVQTCALPISLAHAKASARLPKSVISAQTKTPTIHALRKQPRTKTATGSHPGARTRKSKAHQPRSEEHTSELQSRSDLVCRLLLEKKKKTKKE